MGGYFEIEFSNVRLDGIHQDSIRLNTARNCLEYILLANLYNKIYIPYYTCDVILEPIVRNQIDYSFYHIDKNFEPLAVPQIKQNEAFLYVNYFGIKDKFVAWLGGNTNNLIVDNSQALFAKPISGTDTFYSLRKFVGVADGAFLYPQNKLELKFEKASSAGRVSHLYERKDIGAPFGYESFEENDSSLSGLHIAKMSASTESFLKTYDFEKNKIVRERNFLYLHNRLHQMNEISIDVESLNAPLCYPLLNTKMNIKDDLIKQGIYIPTYWKNVLGWIKEEQCVEKHLVKRMLPLPIDHRYDLDNLNFLIENLIK